MTRLWAEREKAESASESKHARMAKCWVLTKAAKSSAP